MLWILAFSTGEHGGADCTKYALTPSACAAVRYISTYFFCTAMVLTQRSRVMYQVRIKTNTVHCVPRVAL